jgi:hypothetical protein
MNRLYHLHIPRTSGRGICDALWKTFDTHGIAEYSPDAHVPHIVYEDKEVSELPFISGHFARNPIVESGHCLDVFSIIRDPIEHYISIAAYVSKSTSMEMSNEYMDEFMYGNIVPFGANELFSNSGNIQSKMLFCRIGFADKSVVSLRDSDVRNEKNIVFIESDMPNHESMKSQVNTMNLFSLTERAVAIDWLEGRILKSHGIKLHHTIHDVTNSLERNGFKPDVTHIREIKRRSEIDECLYRLVLEK